MGARVHVGLGGGGGGGGGVVLSLLLPPLSLVVAVGLVLLVVVQLLWRCYKPRALIFAMRVPRAMGCSCGCAVSLFLIWCYSIQQSEIYRFVAIGSAP